MKNKKRYLLIITILVIGIFTMCGVSFAKYVSNSFWNYYLKSKEFYFDSDELKESGKRNINTQWDGGSTFISLKNSTNESNITNYDISYKATCTLKDTNTNAKCVLSGTNNNTFNGILSNNEVCVNNKDDTTDVSNYTKTECEVNGYEWVNKVASKDLYFDIISDEEIDEATAVVTVTSTSPYKKTLTGEFVLKKDKKSNETVSMHYNNYTDYDELVVSNSHSEKKCVNIKWDSTKLRIDYDKETIKSYLEDENGYINSIDLTISEKSSNTYKFYKLDSTEQNTSSFTLTTKDC